MKSSKNFYEQNLKQEEKEKVTHRQRKYNNNKMKDNSYLIQLGLRRQAGLADEEEEVLA